MHMHSDTQIWMRDDLMHIPVLMYIILTTAEDIWNEKYEGFVVYL